MAANVLPAFQRIPALTEGQFEARWAFTAASSAALTKPKEQSFVFPCEGSKYRIVVTTNKLPAPAWVEPTVSALVDVQSLPDNWDSYGGRKINHDLISRSLTTLERIMDATSPAPSVVPLTDGGLQLEWHRKQQDLEIVFPIDDTPQFSYVNRTTGTELEGFARDVVTLFQLLQGIA